MSQGIGKNLCECPGIFSNHVEHIRHNYTTAPIFSPIFLPVYYYGQKCGIANVVLDSVIED